MPGPILVGYDASEHADDALELGRLLGRMTGGRVVVACAYPEAPLGERAESVQLARELREEAERTLERARERLDPAEGGDCHAVAGDSPSHVLHDLAEQLGAQLIALGATHQGKGVRRLAGSTPQHVLDGAPCPVAVAPEGFARQHVSLPRQIGVGYDGSAESIRALGLAASLARAADARLRLVRAIDVAFAVAPPMDAAAYTQMARATREGARESLDDALARLADLRAEGAVREGDASQVLVEDAAGDDLLVVGSRGRGPLRRVLLGSVSARVLNDAACPAIVVPRGGDAATP